MVRLVWFVLSRPGDVSFEAGQDVSRIYGKSMPAMQSKAIPLISWFSDLVGMYALYIVRLVSMLQIIDLNQPWILAPTHIYYREACYKFVCVNYTTQQIIL